MNAQSGYPGCWKLCQDGHWAEFQTAHMSNVEKLKVYE